MTGVVRGARYRLRGVRVGEASHPGPPENFQRLRRASYDDDAPLVCSPHREHDTLFDRLVAVPDLQCVWLLLLFFRPEPVMCCGWCTVNSAMGSQHSMILACGPL